MLRGEAEDRWLPSGNQRDDNDATRQKNKFYGVVSDGNWYELSGVTVRRQHRSRVSENHDPPGNLSQDA